MPESTMFSESDRKLMGDEAWMKGKPEAHGGVPKEERTGPMKVIERVFPGIKQYEGLVNDMNSALFGNRKKIGEAVWGELQKRLVEHGVDWGIVRRMREERYKREQAARAKREESKPSEAPASPVDAAKPTEETRAVGFVDINAYTDSLTDDERFDFFSIRMQTDPRTNRMPSDQEAIRMFERIRAKRQESTGEPEVTATRPAGTTGAAPEDENIIEGVFTKVEEGAQTTGAGTRPEAGTQAGRPQPEAAPAGPSRRPGEVALNRAIGIEDPVDRMRALQEWQRTYGDVAEDDLWDISATKLKATKTEEVKEGERVELSKIPEIRILQIREIVKDAVEEFRDTVGSLNLSAINAKISERLGFRKDQSGLRRYLDGLREEDTERVRTAVEREIRGRCELRRAEWQTEQFRINEAQDFGSSTQRYYDTMSTAKISESGATVVTDEYSLAFLCSLPTEAEVQRIRARASSDPSTSEWLAEHPEALVSRESIARTFQVMVQAGELRNKLNRLLRGKEMKWDLTDENFRNEFNQYFGGQRTEIVKGKPVIRYDFTSAAKEAIRNGYGELFSTMQIDIDNFDSGLQGLPDFSKSPSVRKMLGMISDSVGSEDAVNLIWRMFRGLRMEDLYWSGTTLGQLVAYGEGRNYVAINFHSYAGSERGNVAVYDKDSGTFTNPATGEIYEGDQIEANIALKGKYKGYRNESTDNFEVQDVEGDEDSWHEVADKETFPLKGAFLSAKDLYYLTTGPMSVVFTHDGVGGTQARRWYLEWAMQGNFFDKILLEDEGKKGRGDKPIELKNMSNIKAGIEYKAAVKDVGKVGGPDDKTSPESMPALLTRLQGSWDTLIPARAVTRDDLIEHLGVAKEDIFWRRSPYNSQATSGTQLLTEFRFWSPIDFNNFFKALVREPGAAKLFAGESKMGLDPYATVKAYAAYVEKLRVRSVHELDKIKPKFPLRPTPEEQKVLDAQSQAMLTVLPTEIGGQSTFKPEAEIARHQQNVMRWGDRLREMVGLPPIKRS